MESVRFAVAAVPHSVLAVPHAGLPQVAGRPPRRWRAGGGRRYEHEDRMLTVPGAVEMMRFDATNGNWISRPRFDGSGRPIMGHVAKR